MTNIDPISGSTRTRRGFVLMAVVGAAAALAGNRLHSGGDPVLLAGDGLACASCVSVHHTQPAPKELVTLESTVQLAPYVHEMLFNPQIANNGAGDAVAVWE